FNDALLIHLRADAGKIDDTGSQAGSRVDVHIPSVERVTLAGIRQTVDALVDDTRLPDADHLFHMGQRSVIRGDDILSRDSLHRNTPSGGTHTRIHHADKDGSLGPVGHRLYQTVGSLPDVILGYLVGQIRHHQILADTVGHAVHGAHRSVSQSKICLQYKCFFHIRSPSSSIDFISTGSISRSSSRSSLPGSSSRANRNGSR